MTVKTINTFISSINRNPTDSVCDFEVDFQDDLIKCNQDQYIRVNVISFDMLNAMYNIKGGRIEFNIDEYFNAFINIPDGNYSVYSLKKYLEETANMYSYLDLNNPSRFSNYFSLNYNPAQNTYTFLKINANITTPYIKCSFLGFNDFTLITDTGTTGSYINLVNYNKVILRTKNISYDASSIENVRTISSNKLSLSDILFWVSKSDIEPFRNICYNNVDGGNSFNVMLHDKVVNKINLQLTNEYNQLITDAPDFLLVLQFSIHDKEEWFKKTILEIATNIKQIFVSILWLMENVLHVI